MTFSCDFFINRLQISGNDHRLSGKLLVISFLPYFFSQIDGRHEKDFRSWCVFLDLIQQSCDSLSNYICGCSKTVLQSLVPSIRVITSAWACVSRSVGRSAVPFLPSRSDLRKPLFFRTVLPRSRDILLYSVFPGEGLSSVLPTVVSLCSLRHIPMYWNLQSIIPVSFHHIPI